MQIKAASGVERHEEGSSHPGESSALTPAQRRYLARGLNEPGGKLPLFDEDGREIPHRTIESCLAHGWAESWIQNPIKPAWLVCRLTEAGYRVLGQEPPRRRSDPKA